MKNLRLVAFALIATLASFTTTAQVSVSIGQPGFYGRLDIGGFPPPPLLFAEPMIIRPARVDYPPIYLRVPPGHAKKWHRYCDRYRACGRPVYFVQDDWYRHEYAPVYRERHRHHDRHEYRRDYRDGYRDGYRDNDRYDDRGGRGDRGHGHGHGHGRGRD